MSLFDIFSQLLRRVNNPVVSDIQVPDSGDIPLGFHGDHRIIHLIHFLMQQSIAFIETGTSFGRTTRYVGTMFPNQQIYSTEIQEEVFQKAQETCVGLPNVHLYNKHTIEFLRDLLQDKPEISQQISTYWLDAHLWGMEFPLMNEVALILHSVQSAFIVIDDFEVPDRPDFGFDEYPDHAAGRRIHCSFDEIKPAMPPGRYYLIYPKYEGDSPTAYDPLRGIGVLVHGIPDFALSKGLKDLFSIQRVRIR